MVQTTLIILTRNEIEGLKAQIRKIPFEAVDEFFAVDYKSTDGTVEFFKKHQIEVVTQNKPGRGRAFTIALRRARSKYLVFLAQTATKILLILALSSVF